MTDQIKIDRIRELTSQLNAASAAYYGGQEEIMTNFEWDAGFDELRRLEDETGFSLPESPVQSVGFLPDESGQKETHEFPALSLAKTKKLEELQGRIATAAGSDRRAGGTKRMSRE